MSAEVQPFFQCLLDEWLERDVASTRIARVAVNALVKDTDAFMESTPHTCLNELPSDF